MRATNIWLPSILVMLIASGCLTSQEPFYQDGDVVVDDRLVGNYQAENDQTAWHVEKDPDRNNRYLVTLVSDMKPCFMRFSGALFQAGTNRFLDLLPILEACDHIAGGPPSPIEMLEGVAIRPQHMVVKVEASSNGLTCGVMDERGLLAAAKKFPEYFQARPEQLPRMDPDTKRQREFLLRFGGDTNMFKQYEIRRQLKQSH